MPYTAKSYKHVQLVAYELPTLLVTDPGKPAAPLTNTKLPAIDNADCAARLTRMAGVVDHARQMLLASKKDSATTLKVFIAPEFYFRPKNTYNSYSHNQMTSVVMALRGMVTDKGFENWLVIPGTIMSSQPADGIGGVPSGARSYLNTVCLIKGGTDGPFSFVHKRLVSTIDGPPTNEAAILNPNFSSHLNDWRERRNNVWTCDNVRFGIEVCLDHLDHAQLRVLKTTLAEWPAQEKAAPPPIDVHLLTSCGMEFNDRSASARPGGYLFGVDGHPALRSYGGHSQVNRVTKQDLAGTATRTANDASGGNMNAPVLDVPIPLGLLTPAAPGYAQRVVFYPPQPL